MSDELKAFRLAALEEWRTRSFSLGGPLGHLFTRTFEVIQTTVRDGIYNDVSLPYALESLGRERDHAMSRDEQAEDPIRQLVYGLSDALCTMVECIREEIGAAAGGSQQTVSQQQVAAIQQQHRAGVPMGGMGRGGAGGSGVRPGGTRIVMDVSGGAAGGVKAIPTGVRVPGRPQQQVVAANGGAGGVSGAAAAAAPTPAAPATTAASADSNLEEEGSASSDNTLPLFTVKREEPEETEDIGHVRSAFDVANLNGATSAYKDQMVSNFAIKRSLSEEPTTSQTPMVAKQRNVPAAAHAAATDPSRPSLTLFMCDLCDKSYESERGLLRHTFTHSAARCTECNKFVSQKKLAKHMKEKHGGRRSAGRPKKVVRHWNSESSESDDEPVEPVAKKPKATPTSTPAAGFSGGYDCDRCHKSFTSLVGLHRHAYVHDAVPCVVCGRPISSHRMETHMEKAHKGYGRDQLSPLL